MSQPPADLDLAAAVSAALTGPQRAVIEMVTPRLHPWLTGMSAPMILAELRRASIYRNEIAAFLATLPPELAARPCAEYAAIAMRRLGRLYTRPVLEDILARAAPADGAVPARPYNRNAAARVDAALAAEDQWRTNTQIAAAAGCSASTSRKHLALLYAAGQIEHDTSRWPPAYRLKTAG